MLGGMLIWSGTAAANSSDSAFQASASVTGNTVVFCITAPKETKLNGEFGIAIFGRSTDAAFWREALPKIVSESTEYLKTPYRVTLEAVDAITLPDLVTLEVGICTVDGGCDIAVADVNLRGVHSLPSNNCEG
jgi:hypothetical protein